MSNQPQFEKRILHINKSFANVESNLNSEIIYNLKDPLKLRRGDTVSLVKAMVGERGLTADTISFTEEQKITFKAYIYNQANSRKYGEFGTDKHEVQEFGYFPDTTAGLLKDIETNGATNVPLFLIKVVPILKDGVSEPYAPDDYNYYCLPITVEKTILVQPGNYTVATLSAEVEAQMNGQQIDNNTFTNFQLDIQNENKGFAGNFFDNKWILGTMSYKSIYPKAEVSGNPDYDSFGAFICFMPGSGSAPSTGYCFIDGVSFNEILTDGIEDGTKKDINDFVNTGTFYYGLTQGPVRSEYDNLADGMRNNIYGATEFQLIYDTETTDKFSIANFHTPLKVPNFGDYNTQNPDAGQQITKYNARTRNLNIPDNRMVGFYPLECSTGCALLSFDYEKIKETDIYKNNISWVGDSDETILNDTTKYKQYLTINSLRHYEYYTDNITPVNDFENRFWDRLGFTIDQLYNFSSHIEDYYNLSTTDLETTTKFSMRGIITHNDSSYSMVQSAGGLGDGILTHNGVPFQPYSTFGIIPLPETETPTTPRKNTEFNILTTSKFLTASKYPDLLGGKNYYIVQSNLITNNYYDVKSNKSNIIGLINFNFVSNDTIFSTEGIEFPITQDRILNQIIIQLTNPDGSPVSEDLLSKNSGFLIQIVRNLEQELEIQQEENKPIKSNK